MGNSKSMKISAVEEAIDECVAFCANETKDKQPESSLLPSSATFEKKCTETRTALHEFYQQFSSGLAVMLDALKKQGKHEAKLLHFSQEQLTPLQNPAYVQSKLKEGMAIYQLLEISPDTLCKLYETAYMLYETMEYQNAKDAFYFLSKLNPYQQQFWLGLGLCYFRLGVYNEAGKTLLHAIFLDQLNIASYIAAFQALESIRDYKKAREVCDEAISYASQHSNDPRSKELEKYLQKTKQYFATRQ